MAPQKLLILLFFQGILVISVANSQGLKLGYYKWTCPDAEAIVRRLTFQYVSRQPSLAAALLRMHFHDCFVRGCDASVLLKSPNNDAERNAIPNLSLRGYEVIDVVKSALEKKCPGVVSCADILTLVARDAVRVIKGPWWPVPLGRKDGRVSKIAEGFSLPSPFANITILKQNFFAKGLNVKDLVVLSGSHTIGISHCSPFLNRLYNFTGKGDSDPSMNRNYVASLKRRCKPNDVNTIVDMDPGSVKTFDAHYFIAVAQNKGLFTSDAALLQDPETSAYVSLQVSSGGSSFAMDFADSMVKLGKVGVLAGRKGEIRKKCAFVN